jgi:hypothetical protein
MNEQERFLAKHRDSEFRHKDELFGALAAGKCSLDLSSQENASPVTCSHLLNVYRRRTEHLQRYATPHAQRLREDTLALCTALAEIPNESCRIWMFTMPPHSNFAIFEAEERGEILGCVRAEDKRFTPTDEWEKLWHGKNPL